MVGDYPVITLCGSTRFAICSEINTWRDKKESEEANARYNGMLYNGLSIEEEE